MKQFKVKRFANQGEAVKTTIEIDGQKAGLDYKTSRILTDTSGESAGSGIFSNGEMGFRRYQCEIKINFANFDWSASNAWAIRSEIIERCKAVESAFVEKYPAIDETAESTEPLMGTASVKIPSFVSAFQSISSFNAAECRQVTNYRRLKNGIDSALEASWEAAHDEFTPDECDDLFPVFATNGMHVAFFNKCVLVFSGHSVLCVTKYAFEHYRAVLEMENAVVAIYKCPALFIFNNVSL